MLPRMWQSKELQLITVLIKDFIKDFSTLEIRNYDEWMNEWNLACGLFYQHPSFHPDESFLSHLELWRSGDSCKCQELFTARHCLNWPETIQPLLLVNVILWLHLLIFSSQNDSKVLFSIFYTSSLLMRNNWKFIVIFLVKNFMQVLQPFSMF